MLGLGLMLGLAMPAAAQPLAAWGDCAGRVIILGTASQAEGEGFGYWASLSNPGMRPVVVAAGLAGAPPQTFRIEAGRMQRTRLGGGNAALEPAAIEAATRLQCRAG